MPEERRKTMKTTLTIEQSAELIKRGVSAERATIVPLCATSQDEPRWSEPIFTLADLLSLLPKEIHKDDTLYTYNLQIAWDDKRRKWSAMYIVWYDAMRCYVPYKSESTDLCDSFYGLIMLLLDNHVKLD